MYSFHFPMLHNFDISFYISHITTTLQYTSHKSEFKQTKRDVQLNVTFPFTSKLFPKTSRLYRKKCPAFWVRFLWSTHRIHGTGIFTNMSNEKRALGWLGYIGDEKLPSCIGHYFINHEIRIPINHPGFNGK